MSIEPARVEFPTPDGTQLRGTLFTPDDPRAIVVISGATGVPERFYRRFASWLAEDNGLACLTYTYRDMHDDSPRAMRRSVASMQDWAITDGQAARDYARSQFPDLPMWVIGHSLGAMMLSKQPRLDGITRVITIGSGLVDHRQHPMPYRALVYLFWFLLGPATTRMLGYLPGKTIGLGSTLPARVFWQWRDWCTAGPDGFLARTDLPKSDWSRSGAPVRIVGIEDDAICPPVCAFNLAKAYEGAEIDAVRVNPAEHGVRKLGHFGLFTRAGRPWWPALIRET